jgi:hypothetical protein
VDSVDSTDGSSSDVATSRGRGVLGLTGVCHLSNVSSDVVGVVGDSRDPAVGEGDGVGTAHSAGPVVGLALLVVVAEFPCAMIRRCDVTAARRVREGSRLWWTGNGGQVMVGVECVGSWVLCGA